MESWKLAIRTDDDSDIQSKPVSSTTEGVGIVTIYGIPMGWTILPLSLTPEMEHALREGIKSGKSCKQIWKSLIKVSPNLGTIVYRPCKETK